MRLVPRRILWSPFFLALLPSVLFYTVILSRNWIPIHDGFQVTNIAHFIFNEALTHHAVPLWYPYINYGVDINWYFAFTIGPSLATMLAVARLLGRGDLLQYFYLGMFLDEVVLLTGTYLLARTLFKRRLTLVFVCITMTGSILWFAQPWFNFHLYYFVPLSAYLVLTGFARNQLWRVLAGGLALLVSEFGNLPYFPVVHALTYALLVAGAWWTHGFDIRLALRRAGAREVAVLAACALTAAVYLVLLAYGVNHINYDAGRTNGAVVSPESFLTYAEGIGLSKFAELITGVSWDLDANAYFGVLGFGLVVFGLLWAPERRMTPFFLTAAFFTLLSLGKDSFVAPLVAEIPGVAYYRHIGLVLPLIKVMLVVLSGFGLEALIEARQDHAHRAYLILAAILGVMLLPALVLPAFGAINLMRSGHQQVFAELTDATSGFAQLQRLLNRMAFVALVYVTTIAVLLAPLRTRTTATVMGILLLVIQGVDVYSYRMSQFQQHMVPIDASYRSLFAFAEKPFAMERTRDPMSSAAFRVVASSLSEPIRPNWYNQCARLEEMHCYYDFWNTERGTLYNTIEPFVGVDPCRSVFRVDYWFPGVDTFYRAATGMPLHDLNTLPDGYVPRLISFPIGDKRVEKAIGCEFPKLQLFSTVTVIREEREMARFMYDPRYTGDLLLASGRDYASYLGQNRGAEPAEVADDQAGVRPGANTRVGGRVRVLRATANTVVVRTALPRGAGPSWLYFADAWHPFWYAQVNGIAAPILRANFGFKAVRVPGGTAIVQFAYRSGTVSGALAVAQVVSISAMLAVLAVAARLLIHP
ncbi:MAG TPA: hypothetical protein VGZ23_10690 [bacterium]|nr:hypothetical protein [bacterium]